jgi:hypothetical protein
MKIYWSQLSPIYFRRNTVSAQAEGWGIAWLRVNFCHIGLIIPVMFWGDAPVFKWPKWKIILYRFLPLLRVDVWAHTYQSDQRWIFRITIFGFSAGYLTAGDKKETNDPQGWVLDSHQQFGRFAVNLKAVNTNYGN